MDSQDGLRTDLAAVDLDGEVVVYDPTAAASHLLRGGAAIVWNELVRGGPEDLVERVSAATGLAPVDLAQQVDEVVGQLRDLGLLRSSVQRPAPRSALHDEEQPATPTCDEEPR